MTLRRFLLAFCALAPLAGCDLAPAYHLPGIAVPASYKEIGPWQPAQSATAIPAGDWWTLFDDSTLNRLETELDQSNPDLAVAVARYDLSRAMAAEAESGLMPQIGGGADISTNKQSMDRPLRGLEQPSYYGSDDVYGTASYEIDFWGELRNEAREGVSMAQSSAADLAFMRLSLETEMAKDYVSLRGFDSEISLLQETVAAYQQALQLTENLYQGKLVSSQDVSRAQTTLDMAQGQLAALQSQRALMEHAIASLAGIPASSFSIPPQTVTFTLPTVPTGLPSQLLLRRPDIAAAERTVNAANSGIGVARAAFYPSLSLNLLSGFQSTTINLASLPDSFWSVGPDITIPIFEGGMLNAQLAKAYAFFQETSAQYRATVLGAFQEVEDDAAQLRWLGQEYTDETSASAAAQNTLNVATNLYRQGADSYLDVVTAQEALLQAQQTAIMVRTSQVVADVDLIQALGGGWSVQDLPSRAAASRLAKNP